MFGDAINPHEGMFCKVIVFMNVDTPRMTAPGDIEVVHITFGM
jgi:hypothetical protein